MSLTMHPTDPRLLRLHPADNVLTVIRALEAGERISVEGQEVVVAARLPLGHKLAARAIAAGEKIFKYGAPIGSATQAIAPGDHVHMHNLRSDYLPTFLRGESETVSR
ncbi:MAG: altronate dehydratase small subunit [Chthoniobacter sp.]|jgi:hypothetical protein|nr:altronate dehydratase small subunit [Chthoniobacter sp.]